jgi:hypothetical protein
VPSHALRDVLQKIRIELALRALVKGRQKVAAEHLRSSVMYKIAIRLAPHRHVRAIRATLS